MGKFGDSLKRELGKNTGKFVSNKVFGDGHSTPHRVSVSQQKKNAKLEAQLESERKMVAVEEAKLALEKKKLDREEAAKAAERRAEKIEKLKSEGKDKRALLLEFKVDRWGPWAFGIALVIFFFSSALTKVETERLAHEELHEHLRTIETQVLVSIANADFPNALELVEQLNHPSGAQFKNPESTSIWDETTHYNEFWDKKKVEYRDQILEKMQE